MPTISEILCAKNEYLVSAESLTGGLIAEVLTREAGASHWFLGAFVVYTAKMKEKILNVSPDIFERFGVISKECAAAMAKGALQKSGATWALSATGIAGPDAVFENGVEKPVGLVCMAIANQNGKTLTYEKHFVGNRLQIRQQSAEFLINAFLKNCEK